MSLFPFLCIVLWIALSPRQFGRWLYKVRAGFDAQRRDENP